MGYYWTYYLLTFFMAYAVRNPWLCGVIVAFYAARNWLPDPVVILRNLSRVGALKRQAILNPANITVRRDLGMAYLDLRRPRTALKYLDEARARDPRNPDVAFLRGSALLRIGSDDEALKAFGVALGIDAEKGEPFSVQSSQAGVDRSFRRYAEAYLAAAIALERLGRLPQAEEALEMSTRSNSSNVEPLVRLARVRRAQGNAAGAKEALETARSTFRELPWYSRRGQLGWAVRAHLA
jgi:tetratricopeptide (TPR) repeat protein